MMFHVCCLLPQLMYAPVVVSCRCVQLLLLSVAVVAIGCCCGLLLVVAGCCCCLLFGVIDVAVCSLCAA